MKPGIFKERAECMKKRTVKLCAAAVVLLAAVYAAYRIGIIPHRKYTDADFGIETYVSTGDKDGDGIPDQEDILLSARTYLASKPKYKSAYYAGGYPNDGYGVCTDVVAWAMRGAGYDLQELVDEDKKENPEAYNNEVRDANIDFRRVRNLKIWFDRHAQSLTPDLRDTAQWQAGDIVIFRNHIGILSDARNSRGMPFVLHHANILQIRYEEDILPYWGDIEGHYRIG